MNSKAPTILIAPDKFKGSLTAWEVCQHIASGINSFDDSIQTRLHPLADGGEGSLEILGQHLSLEPVILTVNNPIGNKTQATYYKSAHSAFIELAEASGLELLAREERDPLITSTIGTGQLIRHAIVNGAREIILFIGGSATNDAGTGIAYELGYRFLDVDGKSLPPNGANLGKIKRIDSSLLLQEARGVDFTVLTDVNNPLFGPTGAAYVYGPQKGATPKSVEVLDLGLRNFASVISEQFDVQIKNLAGGGAAGGIGAGLFGLFKTELKSGFQSIMEITDLKSKIEKADLVISGEGKLDSQTLEGKVLVGVAKEAKLNDTPFVAFVGQNQLSEKESQPLDAINIFSILEKAHNLDHAISSAGELLEELSYNFAKNYFAETKAANN